MKDHSTVIEYMERVVSGESEQVPTENHHQLFQQRLHVASLITDVGATSISARIRRRMYRILGRKRMGFDRQSEFNANLIGVLGAGDQRVNDMQIRVDALEAKSIETAVNNSMRATVASHDVVLAEVAENQQTLIDDLRALRDVLDESAVSHGQLTVDNQELDAKMSTLRSALGKFERHLGRLNGDLGQTRARLDLTLRAVREDAAAPVSRTLDQVASMRASEFYASFEERFRGSRDDVLETFRAYENDLDRLSRYGKLLDIGSGRAEWLEYLRDHDVDAYGVDINELFVSAGKKRGLDIRLEDGLAHLAALPPGSLGAVSAFHIAEHLPIDTLLDLLGRAYLALKPGGVILIETPNPTNLVVGASNFYLDPTHLRPLHPDLLSFAAEHAGFIDVDVRYLNPATEGLAESDGDSEEAVFLGHVRWSLQGPQDVAVLGVRPGAAE